MQITMSLDVSLNILSLVGLRVPSCPLQVIMQSWFLWAASHSVYQFWVLPVSQEEWISKGIKVRVPRVEHLTFMGRN